MLDLIGDRLTRLAFVIAVEGGDVMKNGRIEDYVETLRLEANRSDITYSEIEIGKLIPGSRYLHHFRIDVYPGHLELRVEGGQRLAPGAGSHAHIGQPSASQEMSGRESHFLLHGSIHALEVAFVVGACAALLVLIGSHRV